MRSHQNTDLSTKEFMHLRPAFANALLAVTSTVVLLVLLELGVRFSGYTPHVANVTMIGRERVRNPLPGIRYLYPAYTSWEQRWPSNPRKYFDPGTSGLSYQVNNYGFRDDDFDIRRNGRIRIAVIGDSFCWGIGVKREHRFTELLERWLNEQAPLGQQFEVYNFCLPGFNTVSEAALYQQVVRYFRPDFLLVWYFLNDVNLPPDLYFKWQAWAPKSLAKWRSKIYLLDWTLGRLDSVVAAPQFVNSVRAAYQKEHPGLRSVESGFRDIRELNERLDVPTLVAIFPWLAQLDTDSYPFTAAHQVVGELATGQGFFVLDLLDAFAGKQTETLWVHRVDHHANETAHRIAGQAVAEYFLSITADVGDEMLLNAAKRRELPIPAALAAPPSKNWYDSFMHIEQ